MRPPRLMGAAVGDVDVARRVDRHTDGLNEAAERLHDLSRIRRWVRIERLVLDERRDACSGGDGDEDDRTRDECDPPASAYPRGGGRRSGHEVPRCGVCRWRHGGGRHNVPLTPWRNLAKSLVPPCWLACACATSRWTTAPSLPATTPLAGVTPGSRRQCPVSVSCARHTAPMPSRPNTSINR
jgi:hypothetical protein